MGILERNYIPCESPDDLKPTSSSGSEDTNVFRPVKIYKLGEKETGIRLQGPVQDYNRLRGECLAAGKLFEDPEFPADDTSLFALQRPKNFNNKKFEWKRPKEIVESPQFFVDGPSRFDVKQAWFGNCWMVAAVSALATRPELLYQVVPRDQSFDKNYAGIFHLRFWQSGKWIEVVIDDRLPTYGGQLICCKSSEENEFWSSLLDKAYAKLHGYWNALANGWSSEALEDFTGGICQCFPLREAPADLFDIMLEAYEKNSLLTCTLEATETKEFKKRSKSLGLVAQHVYSITKVIYVDRMMLNQVEKIPLLRIRNPWGHHEWTGPWSDKSSEWKSISEDEKKELGFFSRTDGEFWMSIQDCKKMFSLVEICYLNPGSTMINNLKNWSENSLEGAWVRGATAGGSIEDLEMFQHNPQYCISFNKESTVVIALVMRNNRTQRANGCMIISHGFHIYKLPEESTNKSPKPLNISFFENNKPLEIKNFSATESLLTFSTYDLHRENSCRIKLKPGTYCIVTSTQKKDQEGEFLLRIFSEEPNKLKEYDEHVGLCEIPDSIRNKIDVIQDEIEKRSIFKNIAGDDWELDWREYKEILEFKLSKELSKVGFSKHACCSIIALLDSDLSGKLGYHEFRTFWKNLKIWKAAYDTYDKNGSGKLKPFQLKQALKSAGFRLNNQTLNLLLRRYGIDGGYIRSDDFFICALRLQKIIDTFEEYASVETNTATWTMKNWIKMMLSRY